MEAYFIELQNDTFGEFHQWKEKSKPITHLKAITPHR